MNSKDIDRPSLEGEVADRRNRWITFEQDDKGRLLIRTLRGFKIIEDPKKADEILRALEDVSGIKEDE